VGPLAKPHEGGAEGGVTMTQRFGGLAAGIRGEAGAAPPLVLLHGLTFDRSTWGPVVHQLSLLEPSRLIVAFDLPGHGESDAQDDDKTEAVVATLDRAVTEAGLSAPVMVGHSVSGVIATLYAARHPTRGVVNVDQPLDATAFAELVQSLEARLRGPEFAELWSMFETSLHLELLPGPEQQLVRSTMQPRQDLVLGYWSQVFEVPIPTLNAMVDAALAEVRRRSVHYTFVSGSAVDPNHEEWLGVRLPEAQVVSWPNSGHFPQLAHPEAFARLLHQTAAW
jgi:pimeloyl-ACP methyl ester carboxylesterase